MRKQLEYSVHTLIPYINWVYFDHAWGVSGKTGDEKKSLREDAMLLLEKMNTNNRIQCVFRLCEANSDGDDIIVDGVRIPMLRQQQTTPSLCLADFIRPKSMGIADRIGLFATTCHNLAQEPSVEGCAKCDDPYQKMLLQTLSDRLAEAAAEVLPERELRVSAHRMKRRTLFPAPKVYRTEDRKSDYPYFTSIMCASQPFLFFGAADADHSFCSEKPLKTDHSSSSVYNLQK